MLNRLFQSPFAAVTALAALLLLGACSFGKDHPTEEQIKSYLSGRYCSDDLRHRMEITQEGRYSGHRSQMSAFGTLLPEKCEGNYKLNYDSGKNTWTLVYEPSDKNSNPFIKCKGSSVVVWEGEKGYLVGDSTSTLLTDPLDGVAVSSKCDL